MDMRRMVAAVVGLTQAVGNLIKINQLKLLYNFFAQYKKSY